MILSSYYVYLEIVTFLDIVTFCLLTEGVTISRFYCIYYTTQNFFTILTVWTKIVMGFLPHQLSKLSKHEKIVFVRSWCLQVKSCILLYQIFQIYEIIFSFFAIVKEHPKNRFGKSLKIRFYIT